MRTLLMKYELSKRKLYESGYYEARISQRNHRVLT